MVTSVPFEFEGGSSIQIERQRAHKRVDGADVRESTFCNANDPTTHATSQIRGADAHRPWAVLCATDVHYN